MSIVRRRFEVHGSGRLDDIESALREAEKKVPPEEVRRLTIDKCQRAKTVSVDVEATATAAVMLQESIPRADGEFVYRDWIEVPVSDEGYPDQRSLTRIDPHGRSRREAGSGERVLVAVVDSGITVDHPNLSGYLWTDTINGQTVHGARFMDGQHDYDITDQDGHGTMLAGTILATANFVAGVEIMALKFFDITTQPQAPNAVAAIRFAVENRANIIDLSFDLGIGSFELEQAIGEACAAGALVVMAAGNTGSNNDEYPLIPAYYARSNGKTTNRDEAIVVMATDWYDERPTFSNFGARTVDLAAPGVRIVSTRASLGGDASVGEYSRYTGTSPAAAQVTGAAALLKSTRPEWSAANIKARLMETVDRLPRLKCASGGRLNLGRAL